MRPRTLDEYIGQTHILGPGQLLRRAIEADRIQSLIFYGPPGTGKTSLAHIIARQTRSKFERLSGVESNVADMRRVLSAAVNRLENTGQTTILFIDEIHRFNKSQQDVLLPDVESGVIKLIGATTHNPFFFVNSPLVSRSQIFELRPLTEDDLLGLLRSALADSERGLAHLKIAAADDALHHLAKISDGDARKALNSLEIAALTTPPDADGTIRVTLGVAEQSIQKKAVVYDGDGDAHYDTISAYIKSMRGCDADASLYWLAKMIHAGEDPRFITRRIVICAAEELEFRLRRMPDLEKYELTDAALEPNDLQAPKRWMAQASAPDRRTARRKRWPRLVAHDSSGGIVEVHGVKDMSASGLYLMTEERWPLGAPVTITLQRTDGLDDNPRNNTVTVQLRVVRWGTDGVGLSFVQQETEESPLLAFTTAR